MTDCCVVMATHRSGSSALAGSLQKLGINLGSQLLRAHRSNPLGHFENQRLCEFNEYILNSISSSWKDIYFLYRNLDSLDRFRAELGSIITAEFLGQNLSFAIKDPRLCLLYPLYKKVFADLNIQPKIIILFRNPIESALSLLSRDRLSLEYALLVTLICILEGEFHTRGDRRTFVYYTDLLTQPVKTLSAISQDLAVAFPISPVEGQDELRTFLRPDLRNQNAGLQELPSVPLLIDRIVEAISTRDEANLPFIFDSIRQEMKTLGPLFQPQEVRDLQYKIDLLTKGLSKSGSDGQQTLET